jgi:hypothetical protein
VVREAILAEELKCSLHPPDGRQLSVELDKAYACTDRIDGERATKVKRLSWQVVRISGILVDLGMLPVQNIPQLPKSAQKVLPVVSLVL